MCRITVKHIQQVSEKKNTKVDFKRWNMNLEIEMLGYSNKIIIKRYWDIWTISSLASLRREWKNMKTKSDNYLWGKKALKQTVNIVSWNLNYP